MEAAPAAEATTEDTPPTENSSAFSFISANFDPSRALQAVGLQPPDSSVEPLPSLEDCIAILPKESLSITEIQYEGESTISTVKDTSNVDLPVLDQKSISFLSPFSLDFFSPDFDALQALYAKDLVPPNPRVRPLDNLSSCRRILPEEVPESAANVPVRAPRSAESILAQERAKAHKSVLLLKAAERERQVKIFDKIAEKLKHGPLGLLANCYFNHLRVKVWTRHSRGVRGSLTGFVLAFDKHLNLVLRDIDEEYTVRRWVPRLVNHRGKSTKAHVNAVGKDKNDEGSDTAHKSTLMNEELIGNTQSTEAEITEKLKELRVFPKLEHRWRHLNQVFLRGDSVVMVQKLT